MLTDLGLKLEQKTFQVWKAIDLKRYESSQKNGKNGFGLNYRVQI